MYREISIFCYLTFHVKYVYIKYKLIKNKIMNPIEITQKIKKISLKHGCNESTIKFIVLVYYNQYSEAVSMHEGTISDETKKLCEQLLREMLASQKTEKYSVGPETYAHAMKWKDGILVLGGMEPNDSKLILSETLQELNIWCLWLERKEPKGIYLELFYLEGILKFISYSYLFLLCILVLYGYILVEILIDHWNFRFWI